MIDVIGWLYALVVLTVGPLLILYAGRKAHLLLFFVGGPSVLLLSGVGMLISGDPGLMLLGLMLIGVAVFALSAIIPAIRKAE